MTLRLGALVPIISLRTQTVFSIIVSWLLAGAVMQAVCRCFILESLIFSTPKLTGSSRDVHEEWKEGGLMQRDPDTVELF